MRRSRILIIALTALALGTGAFVYWRSVMSGAVVPFLLDDPVMGSAADPAATPHGVAFADPGAAQDAGSGPGTIDAASALAPRPYRASPAQRQHDQQRLLTAEDRVVLAREFEQRAARGEVDAARAMRDLVNDCDDARMASDPVQRPFFERMADLGDAHAQWVQFSLAHWHAIMPSCERLLGPAAGWPEGVRLAWTERAAALGDPGARLEIGGLTREPGIQRDAVRAILLEGDPLQWMRYSMSLAPHADLDGSLLSPTAFFWAGCARIPACAADPVAYLYDPASPTGSMAERWMQAMALWDAPRSRAIAEAQARRINEHVAAGRIDRLLPPERKPAGP